MDEIAIVLACDDRYAQHAAVAAASMLLCHTDSRPLHFYLFDDGITGVKKRDGGAHHQGPQRSCDFY